MLAIPTFFDLLATILMNIGLLWVTASVYQACIVRVYMCARVYVHEYACMSVCMEVCVFTRPCPCLSFCKATLAL